MSIEPYAIFVDNAKYHTLPTSQKELDDSIARAYKRLIKEELLDEFDYNLVMPLREVEHEIWVKTVLNTLVKKHSGVLYSDLRNFFCSHNLASEFNFDFVKIGNIETDEQLKEYVDYFPSGFHSLINGRLSFYAYRFNFVSTYNIHTSESSDWLHIVFFRDRKKQLRLFIPQAGYTQKVEKYEYKRPILKI